MELAATFYYISASIVIWVVGIILVIFLITLIKTLRIMQETAKQVKTSVTNFELMKQAISSGIISVVENFIGKKLLRGGGKRG